ncbi:MAG: hypothetical protein ACRDPI_07225 [Nocardioidaceae bacterium]
MPTDVIAIDETSSYAYRDGKDVHLVLRLPASDLESGAATVRFVSGKRRFRRPATAVAVDGGVTLELSAPATRLGHLVWKIAVLRVGPQRLVRIQARLLASNRQPVALLPGPTSGRTALPGPVRRPRRRSILNRASNRTARWAVRSALDATASLRGRPKR